MTSLFAPATVGRLALRNRLMRSATAERLADAETGAPRPALAAMYDALAEGGVGLIVTGHCYVERAGQAHPEMASIASDSLIPTWRQTIAGAQARGARMMMQINHGGASCDPAVTPEPLSPSGIATNPAAAPRAMTEAEAERIVAAFARAAWRAREAGFDGVQLHGAHGYLVSQFLTPATNTRSDRWGPGADGDRTAFLRAIISGVREAVGPEYPVWIKLGVAGEARHGLDASAGARVAADCRDAGVDLVEVSHGLGVPEDPPLDGEAPYLPLAEAVRRAVGPDYPLALVRGIRSRRAMEGLLESGTVQVISLCRPLIVEPDLPEKLASGRAQTAACLSCGACWPRRPGEGIGCHNAKLVRSVD